MSSRRLENDHLSTSCTWKRAQGATARKGAGLMSRHALLNLLINHFSTKQRKHSFAPLRMPADVAEDCLVLY